MQVEALGSRFLPRYRLPSEDDDAFDLNHPITTFSRPHSGDRGVKRSRLPSDDDVFFRPRARLTSDSSPQFPRARLPSDSDCSSVYYPRHRRFRAKENHPLLQPPRDSSSIQLSSSQYTADDTPDPAFKTPYSRPLRRRSSEVSNLQANSTRDSCHQELKDPPSVTRTPFAWISPNISDVSHAVPMSDESITDVRLRLFHQINFRSSVSDNSFSPLNYIHGTSTQAAAPTTSSPKEADCPQNLAHSILAEEMRSDSGISSLPSFDGQVGFNQYQKDFGEKLVDVMVKILNKVEPSNSPVPDQHHLTCCPVTEQVPDPHQPSSCPLSIPDLPDISIFSSPDNYASSNSSQASCFDSPREVFPYPVPAPAQSPPDISAPVDFLSSLPRLISSSVIPSAPTPAPSPSDVSASVHSLSSLYSQALTSVSEASPVPVSLPQKKKTSSTKKSSQCKICHKVLANSSNLKVHMRIHTGDRPFVCPHCFNDFNDRSTFRRHERLHIRKPFVCEHCSGSFVTRSKLYIHEQKCH